MKVKLIKKLEFERSDPGAMGKMMLVVMLTFVDDEWKVFYPQSSFKYYVSPREAAQYTVGKKYEITIGTKPV